MDFSPTGKRSSFAQLCFSGSQVWANVNSFVQGGIRLCKLQRLSSGNRGA
ncbi:hypothetical protein LEP1GSC193_0955 [Leptospira alstonii serovar Pingchang str. 80-412]|uniref:Uncharacterized protein n=2 Tax=Leptospira alstonii TaxID=28452 RepID=M6CHZ7_9LEPT|nr:hypothetical protein LEP1GSC194_0644 [Leptospira alstonii serovar Sichuan str. 79601]EQA82391.1 hypothetical protein LEP1GSC193_0955 [Leptospira alstonii serovar Pingchang str. 80-412]